MFKRNLFLIALVLSLCLCLVGCGDKEPQTDGDKADLNTNLEDITDGDYEIQFNVDKSDKTEPIEKYTIKLGTLAGPTGLGLGKLMQDNEDGVAYGKYEVSVATSPDELVAKLVNGELDIATIPTNLAANLYQKTKGDIKVIALNTGSNLYILENGSTVNSIKDLSGKTIYATGQGATPQYALETILEANGVKDCKVEYKADHSELATLMASGDIKIAMSPEPFASSVMLKNKDVRVAINLGEEWEKATGSKLYTGCAVATKSFIEEHNFEPSSFICDGLPSVNYANENIDEAAELAVKFGIIKSADIAKAAIPNCDLEFKYDTDMKTALESLYSKLYECNPASVGGSLPDEDFYYINN